MDQRIISRLGPVILILAWLGACNSRGAVSDLALQGDGLSAGKATFIGDRTEELCQSTLPVCKGQTAGCMLDQQHYLQGTFPGGRKVLLETTSSGVTIRVMLLLEDKLSPGTETEVTWFGPGCSDLYTYKLSRDPQTSDLFKRAGAASVLTVEQEVEEEGDHLISVWSDAACKYVMRVDVF
jgi:hypothetical protein